MRIATAGAGFAVVATLLLGGCTVETTGLVGITRGDDGQIEALIAMCDGHVNSVVVYGGAGSNEKTLGTWDLAEPVTDSATLALPSPHWHYSRISRSAGSGLCCPSPTR